MSPKIWQGLGERHQTGKIGVLYVRFAVLSSLCFEAEFQSPATGSYSGAGSGRARLSTADSWGSIFSQPVLRRAVTARQTRATRRGRSPVACAAYEPGPAPAADTHPLHEAKSSGNRAVVLRGAARS